MSNRYVVVVTVCNTTNLDVYSIMDTFTNQQFSTSYYDSDEAHEDCAIMNHGEEFLMASY